jgi:hypothetical protein
MKSRTPINRFNFLRFHGTNGESENTFAPYNKDDFSIYVQGMTVKINADFYYKEAHIYQGNSELTMTLRSVLDYGLDYTYSLDSYYLTPFFKAVIIKEDGTRLESEAIQRTSNFNISSLVPENAIVGKFTGAGNNNEQVRFNEDGTKFFYQSGTQEISAGYLKTPYVLSDSQVITSAESLDVSSEETSSLTGFTFSPNGRYLFIIGTTAYVHRYTLSTPWNLNTATYDVQFDLSTEESTPEGIQLTPDGRIMYIIGSGGDKINQYSIPTNWDVSSAVAALVLDTSSQDTIPQGLFIRPDYKKVFVLGRQGSAIDVYTSDTALRS